MMKKIITRRMNGGRYSNSKHMRKWYLKCTANLSKSTKITESLKETKDIKMQFKRGNPKADNIEKRCSNSLLIIEMQIKRTMK